MLKAIDVANFFIDFFSKIEENDLTNKKVNKLVYYAQAWHLAKYGTPIFNEDVQAWEHGPVVKSVYNKFRIYGKLPISTPTNEYDTDIYSEEETNFLLEIIRNYGIYSAWELENMTHVEGSPWNQCYKKGSTKQVIPADKMVSYFKNKELKTLKLDTSKIPRIGRYDVNGHIILPSEWDCPEDQVYDNLSVENTL